VATSLTWQRLHDSAPEALVELFSSDRALSPQSPTTPTTRGDDPAFLAGQVRTTETGAPVSRPSSQVIDWSREQCAPFEWKPARQLMRAVRDYRRARERGGVIGTLERKSAVLRHRFWAAVSGAEIPLNSSRIAGGLLIPHPNGVVIHPDAKLGPNCLVFQQVTIGTGPVPGVPTLGGCVDVGPGAKILGGVTIGDGAIIGANSVVIHDVPAGAVAVGVPAVIKRTGPRDVER
jgi:serine O-acetyltransferase